MPHFCPHNRLAQNCPICTGKRTESAAYIRALSPDQLRARRRDAAQAEKQQQVRKRSVRETGQVRTAGRSTSRGIRVRATARVADDGYRNQLVSGIKLSADVRRLAEELAFAASRLATFACNPPDFYVAVMAAESVEETIWQCFLAAYFCPLEVADEDPFAAICSVAQQTPWLNGGSPSSLSHLPLGPRTSHDSIRGDATLVAYRAWAERSATQITALQGESYWSPERRFDRLYERLALSGLNRAARYDFLLTLGSLGLVALRPQSLYFKADDEVAVAAKRVFGIADPLILEQRAKILAQACELPLGAFDLALYNWGCGERVHLGFPDTVVDHALQHTVFSALGL